MASLPDLISDVETAVDAIAGGTRSRMSQDYGDETGFSALGQTRYQLRATLLNRVQDDSAASKEAAQVEVVVHHALASVTDEPAYQAGQMATDQAAMLQRSFWESLASVYGLVPDDIPGVNQQPERVGKRMTYSILVQVVLAP